MQTDCFISLAAKAGNSQQQLTLNLFLFKCGMKGSPCTFSALDIKNWTAECRTMFTFSLYSVYGKHEYITMRTGEVMLFHAVNCKVLKAVYCARVNLQMI